MAAVTVVPFDTTGLPEGATFGPTMGGPGASATIGPGVGPTIAPAVGPTIGPGPGPTGGAQTMYGATGVGTIGGAAAGTGTGTGELGVSAARRAGPLKVGQAFGPRYHIIKLLGVGGMGAVYQTWDAELGVAVALKVIVTDRTRGAASAEAEKRFKTELLLARQVTHKHVVRIHDLGEIDGIKYITMPYVQGDDLGTLLRREGKLPIPRVMRFARQIAGGLQAAHEAGVVHRDLKPPNIMIGGAGDDEQALIMDFGISASTDENTAGTIVGTLEYMSPEQGTGKAVDGRSDLYAFGLILYELLTGPRPSPTTGPERVAAMRERFEKGLPALRTLDEAIPEPLAGIVMRCLERDPAMRFQGAAEVAAALAALDDQGELIPIPPRFSKRLIAVLSLVMVALLVGTYTLTRRAVAPVKQHEPMSVLIADFQNQTGDATFDRSLESVLKLALEGAGFITAYDRTNARAIGAPSAAKLDEATAMQVAVKQGAVGIVVSGTLKREGDRYGIAVKATHALTGKVLTSASTTASSKDRVLAAATKLATTVRTALGDDTTKSDAQIFAMDTLSATNLDVVRQYAAATELMASAKFDEALASYRKSVELDPNFGMGYQGMALASRNLDRNEDAEKYIKEGLRHLDRMTERERFRARGFFYRVTGDYQACVKEYGDLLVRYSADVAAHNQIALCSTYLRNMPRAVDEMQRVVKIVPNSTILQNNLALYQAYSGNFEAAEQTASAIQNPGVNSIIALAFGQLGLGKTQDALATYERLKAINAQGASRAVSGAGDVAIYEGRFTDAARILSSGADADLAAKEPNRAAAKYAAAAYAQLMRQQNAAAITAAETALKNSQTVKIRFLAGRILAEAGNFGRAQTVSAGLAAELQAEPQAHAKIIDGVIALKKNNVPQAIKLLTDANAQLDTWIGHFDLGRAFLQANEFIRADSEFDRCTKRRGEALSLFLEEEPTFGYLPPLYYYQGRVREGMNIPGFADSYREYLKVRGESTQDPLLPDVRRRAGS